MTFQEIVDLVDELPDPLIEKLETHLLARRHRLEMEKTMADIREILKDAPPVEFKGGTMDIDKLHKAIEAMREGLSEEDIEEMISAMTGKPIQEK